MLVEVFVVDPLPCGVNTKSQAYVRVAFWLCEKKECLICVYSSAASRRIPADDLVASTETASEGPGCGVIFSSKPRHCGHKDQCAKHSPGRRLIYYQLGQ